MNHARYWEWVSALLLVLMVIGLTLWAATGHQLHGLTGPGGF